MIYQYYKSNYILIVYIYHYILISFLILHRPTQLAELPCREFDPELFPHSAYVQFL